MAHMCRKLRATSSIFLQYENRAYGWQNALMDMRDRINAVIAANPTKTVRSVSLAAGLSDSMLSKFLKGSTDSMTIRNAEKLADALEVDAQWLIFGEGDPDQASNIADRIERLSAEHQALIDQLINQLGRNGTYG